MLTLIKFRREVYTRYKNITERINKYMGNGATKNTLKFFNGADEKPPT